MKRRLFAKNLAALLAIPFVAKADQYAPKVGKKVTRGGVEKDDGWEEIKEVDTLKGPLVRDPIDIVSFENVLVLYHKGEQLRLQVHDISLESNVENIEVFSLDRDDYLTTIPGKVNSTIRISGLLILNNIHNFYHGEAKFTLFLDNKKEHYVKGEGFITEMSIDSDRIMEFCIEINGELTATYEGNLFER